MFRDARSGVRGSRYALVEYGFDLRVDATKVVEAVLAAGKRMIVSHPERYRRDGQPVSVAEILSWKKAGALLQVNGGSVLGDYGERIAQTAWRLLEDGQVDLIATDHHADSREVSPAAVAERLLARLSVEAARLLMCENPAHVLDDQ